MIPHSVVNEEREASSVESSPPASARQIEYRPKFTMEQVRIEEEMLKTIRWRDFLPETGPVDRMDYLDHPAPTRVLARAFQLREQEFAEREARQLENTPHFYNPPQSNNKLTVHDELDVWTENLRAEQEKIFLEISEQMGLEWNPALSAVSRRRDEPGDTSRYILPPHIKILREATPRKTRIFAPRNLDLDPLVDQLSRQEVANAAVWDRRGSMPQMACK